MKILPKKLQIEFEKVDFVYDHLATGLILNLLVGGALCAILQQAIGLNLSLAWYGVLAAVVAIRFTILFLYKRSKDKITKLAQWKQAFIIGAAMMGIVWGAGGIILFPESDVARQVIISFFIGGMAMGAVPYLSPMLPAYVFFLLSAEIPHNIYLLSFNDSFHAMVGMVNMLFVVAMFVAAKLNQKSFLQNLNLRFINQNLVDRLNDTNNELEHKIYLKNKIEQDLRDNEHRFKSLADAAHDGVIIHKDGVVLEANEAVAKMVGSSIKDLIGKSVLEFIAPDCHEDIVHRLGEPKEETFETTGLREDGSTFKAELNRGKVHYQGSDMRIVSVRDISKQKQIEEDLLHAKNTAEEADNLKSEFLALVSHELRTPLNAIIGIMQILNDTKLNKEQHDYLGMGENAANQLLLLINDLLDLSKVDSGHVNLNIKSASLNVLLYETVQLMSFKAEEQNNKIKLSISEDLPEWVCVDADRVRQVLINLLGNANKFTDAGNITLHVSTGISQQDKNILRFEVTDDGIGVPEEKQALIFNRFTQLESSISRNYGGTGLGLAISKELVNKMDGEIGVTSQSGKGSTFWFTLPLTVASKPDTDKQADNSNSSHNRKFVGLSVLVVEDDETNQIIAKRMLEKLGCQVDVSSNGQQAVDTDKHYELIFMDMQMPVLDGLAATKCLRDKGIKTSIIALTANAMEDDRERCKLAGMNDYLSKPVKMESLIQVLDRWCPVRQASASG